MNSETAQQISNDARRHNVPILHSTFAKYNLSEGKAVFPLCLVTLSPNFSKQFLHEHKHSESVVGKC